MTWTIIGQGKIGLTDFDGKVYVGLDVDGSVELRTVANQAYVFEQLEPVTLLAQLLTTHHSSRLTFTVVASV
jgi:hypothetical protein